MRSFKGYDISKQTNRQTYTHVIAMQSGVRPEMQCETSIQFMNVYVSFHAGRDFNDTVIETRLPAAQTQLMQAFEIFDDEINEGREVFNVSLEVVGNISTMVTYRIQTTLCRIRQSDRKLSYKICMHFMYAILQCM